MISDKITFKGEVYENIRGADGDDIFFHKIAEDKEVCEEMLRIILEMPKLRVIQSQVQRFLRNNGAHSVVLDALTSPTLTQHLRKRE